MKSTQVLLGVTALVLGTAGAARACKYCWAAAADGQDMAQVSMRMHGTSTPPGDFPLDGAIGRFQPTGAPTALTTPPPAGSIATSAADLRPPTSLALAPVPVAPASPSPVLPSAPAAAIRPAAAGSARWADAGLVGLAAAGSLFCWRTRRTTHSVH